MKIGLCTFVVGLMAMAGRLPAQQPGDAQAALHSQIQASARLAAESSRHADNPPSTLPRVMSQSSGNHWVKGMEFGAAIGAVLGVAAYVFYVNESDNRHDSARYFLVPVAVVGVLGAFIGSFSRKR